MAERRATASPGTHTLVVVLAWLALSWLVLLTPVVRDTALRPLVLFSTALVLPGYALFAAAFPHGDGSVESSPGATERVAFAIALSVAVSTMLGIALLAAPVDLTSVTALAGLTVVALAGALLGAVRRGPEFSPRSIVTGVPTTVRERLAGRDDTGERTSESDGDAVAMAVAGLVIAATVSGGGVTVFLLGVHEPAGFAELSIAPAEGAGNASFVVDDGVEVTLTDHRNGATEYTVVAVAQRMGTSPNTTVVEPRRLERFDVTLAEGETWSTRHTPSVPWPGENVRIAYHLYRGDASIDGGPVAEVHVWVRNATGATDVTETADGTDATTSVTSTPELFAGASAP